MGFVCRICGSCCMYLGDYIIIEEQTGPYSFNCCCVSTGTVFSARIDQNKQKFFDEHTFSNLHPHACPFLRPLSEGMIGCTIHADSPAQCKNYRCEVMRIHASTGEQIGYVTGTLALHSEDGALRKLWNDRIFTLTGEDTSVETQIKEVLIKAGYQVT